MTKKSKPDRVLENDFRSFLENHPPDRFSSNLRRIVLDHIRCELKHGSVPLYLDDFLGTLNDLFDILDMASHEASLNLNHGHGRRDENNIS